MAQAQEIDKARVLAHLLAQLSDLSAPVEYRHQLSRTAESIEGMDLIDELVDVRDLLADLARKGDAARAGAVVVAVFNAYVARCADQAVYGSECAGRLDAMGAATAAVAS